LCRFDQDSWDYLYEDPWEWYFARLFIAVELKDGSGRWVIVSTCTVEVFPEPEDQYSYSDCNFTGEFHSTSRFEFRYASWNWLEPYHVYPHSEALWLEEITNCYNVDDGIICGGWWPWELCGTTSSSILIFHTDLYRYRIPGEPFDRIEYFRVTLPETECEKWCPFDPAIYNGQLLFPDDLVNTVPFYGALSYQQYFLLDTEEQDQQ
jgi:hypothetical protein